MTRSELTDVAKLGIRPNLAEGILKIKNGLSRGGLSGHDLRHPQKMVRRQLVLALEES